MEGQATKVLVDKSSYLMLEDNNSEGGERRDFLEMFRSGTGYWGDFRGKKKRIRLINASVFGKLLMFCSKAVGGENGMYNRGKREIAPKMLGAENPEEKESQSAS